MLPEMTKILLRFKTLTGFKKTAFKKHPAGKIHQGKHILLDINFKLIYLVIPCQRYYRNMKKNTQNIDCYYFIET